MEISLIETILAVAATVEFALMDIKKNAERLMLEWRPFRKKFIDIEHKIWFETTNFIQLLKLFIKTT